MSNNESSPLFFGRWIAGHHPIADGCGKRPKAPIRDAVGKHEKNIDVVLPENGSHWIQHFFESEFRAIQNICIPLIPEKTLRIIADYMLSFVMYRSE